jgi:hypothetical protein
MLRAKYYLDGDILKAGPKAGSSFTWQSILAGITTFKCDYIWRVSNGEKINIWSDPWIPSSPDRKVLSPRGGAVYTKVSDLIDPITAQWDSDPLYSLFGDVDVHRILQIPLHRQGFDDLLHGVLLNMDGTRSVLVTIYNGVTSLVHLLLKWPF